MSYDPNPHNYGIAIQDYDGFSFGGITRYVAYDGTTRGKKILLGKYTMSWKAIIDSAKKTNVPLTSENTYSKHMPIQKHVGIEARVFTVDCAIDTLSKGLDFAPVGYQKLTLPILQDLIFFNHRYYITDYFGTEPSTETPIYQLMNDTSGLYYTLYSSQSIGMKGLPVVIESISNFRIDPDDPGIITFQMTLVEDSND